MYRCQVSLHPLKEPFSTNIVKIDDTLIFDMPEKLCWCFCYYYGCYVTVLGDILKQVLFPVELYYTCFVLKGINCIRFSAWLISVRICYCSENVFHKKRHTPKESITVFSHECEIHLKQRQTRFRI